MTMKAVRAMSNRQMNERIALATGWEKGPSRNSWYAQKNACWHRVGSKEDWQDFPPWFSGDLNAMHEVEAKLGRPRSHTDWAKLDSYRIWLEQVVEYKPVCSSAVEERWNVAFASARQRAIAYILMLDEMERERERTQ